MTEVLSWVSGYSAGLFTAGFLGALTVIRRASSSNKAGQ